jgi:hypothetical protein
MADDMAVEAGHRVPTAKDGFAAGLRQPLVL